jgi:NitT/TauT family transport system substrate-binding protein
MTVMIKSNSLGKYGFQAFVLFLLIMSFFNCNPKSVNVDGIANKTDSKVTGTTSKKELKEVTFLPYWVTNSQFVGYYVAEEKGIYEKYGIKITIIPYRPFITSSDLIKEGKADFAALWLVNAIELKANGTDIVNIAQPSARSSAMLITKKKSGINSVQQMDGKKAGIWSGFELQPRTFFKIYNLDVKIVPIGSTNNLFLMDGVDITIANWFDEYHSIINSGYDPEDLNVFFFADYGLNFLEDGIYCLSDKLKKDPEVCANFVKATLEGWRYAFSHREEAINIVLKRAKEEKLPVNRVHQEWMIDRYKDLYLPEGKTDFNNSLSESDYLFVGKVLKEGKLIKEVPPFNNFYQPIIKN